MIFSTSELHKINFEEVLQDSPESCRKSLDGTKTFVKWYGDIIPPSVQSLTTAEGPYTIEELHPLVSNSDWIQEEYLL